MHLKLYQVDAFAKAAFSGNPAAVCPLQKWLPTEILQKIANENNLSETAYYVPERHAYHIRWFTPQTEVDLCGHATLATAFVLYHYEDFQGDELVFHSKSGPLTVVKEGDWLSMNFPSDQYQKVMAPGAVWEGLGLVPDECYLGRSDYLAVFKNQKIIESLQPNFSVLKKLKSRGLICTAPGDEVDFVSRCFYPQAGIDEDPATGSAHTTMTPYWSKRLEKTELDATQLSDRKGHFKCVYLEERVEIKGQVFPYLIGEIDIPWD